MRHWRAIVLGLWTIAVNPTVRPKRSVRRQHFRNIASLLYWALILDFHPISVDCQWPAQSRILHNQGCPCRNWTDVWLPVSEIWVCLIYNLCIFIDFFLFNLYLTGKKGLILHLFYKGDKAKRQHFTFVINKENKRTYTVYETYTENVYDTTLYMCEKFMASGCCHSHESVNTN